MSMPDGGGVLALLKPVGPSSHDLVARARRWFPGQRIGHLGTLDPAAAGLLLLAVGEIRRAARLIDAEDTVKRYRAWAVFGLETEGDDADGQVVARRGAHGFDEAALRAAAQARVGRQMQVPPARSAVRVAGRRAYERARAGEEVRLAARPIVVERAEVLRVRPLPGAADLVEALLELWLWRGGYVRAFVRDLGEALGTGATVRVLVRGGVGSVGDADGLTLDEAEEMARGDALGSRLLCADQLLGHLPTLIVPFDADGRQVGRGRPAPRGALGWARLVAAPGAGAWAVGDAQDGRWREIVRLRRRDAEAGR